jgi:hypothetical protein
LLVMTKPALWYVSDAIVSEYAMVLARPELKIRRNLLRRVSRWVSGHRGEADATTVGSLPLCEIMSL